MPGQPLVVTNTAVVSSSTPDDLLANNTAQATMTLAEEAITDLAVVGISPVYLNGTGLFTATITNGSNVGFEWNFGDGTPNLVISPTRGLSRPDFVVTHVYTSTGFKTVIVTATNSVSSQSATVMVEVVVGDLALAQQVQPDLARPGDTVTFTVPFTNQGSIAVQSPYFMNLAPVELLNPIVTASMPITQHPTLDYVFYLPPLPVGATGMITITATVDPAITADMVITNVVYIDGAPVDVDPMNNFAATTLTITLEPIEPEPTLLFLPAVFNANSVQANGKDSTENVLTKRQREINNLGTLLLFWQWNLQNVINDGQLLRLNCCPSSAIKPRAKQVVTLV